MLNYLIASVLLLVAAYCICLARAAAKPTPPLEPIRKVCWHCYARHDEPGNHCPACHFALFPDGVVWIWAQQEIDQIQERLWD